MNIGKFQTDITSLVRNGRLKYLFLNGLNELRDEFFECLFLSHPIVFPPSEEDYPGIDRRERSTVMEHAYESIETLELRDLNGITSDMVYRFLIDQQNSLREINLHACKYISRSDIQRFNYIISKRNLNCRINWT